MEHGILVFHWPYQMLLNAADLDAVNAGASFCQPTLGNGSTSNPLARHPINLLVTIVPKDELEASILPMDSSSRLKWIQRFFLKVKKRKTYTCGATQFPVGNARRGLNTLHIGGEVYHDAGKARLHLKSNPFDPAGSAQISVSEFLFLNQK